MFIKNWKYGFKGDAARVYLYCKFTLECPNCHSTLNLQTSSHDAVNNIKVLAGYFAGDINEYAGICNDCGLQSAVPKRDRAKFTKELCKKITPELIGRALRVRLNRAFKLSPKSPKSDREYINKRVRQYVEDVKAENKKEPD